MRGSIWAALLSLAMCFSLAWMDGQLRRLDATQPPDAPQFSAVPEQTAAPAAPETLRVLDGETVREMDMQDYLVGVVAAEMPADFAPEALKAQAVAARTYALYCRNTSRHENADVCTD